MGDRNATHIFIVTAQSLGHNIDDLIINRSSILRVRENLRELRSSFNSELFKESVVHREGRERENVTVINW